MIDFVLFKIHFNKKIIINCIVNVFLSIFVFVLFLLFFVFFFFFFLFLFGGRGRVKICFFEIKKIVTHSTVQMNNLLNICTTGIIEIVNYYPDNIYKLRISYLTWSSLCHILFFFFLLNVFKIKYLITINMLQERSRYTKN